MAKKKRDLANPLAPSEGIGEYGAKAGAKAGKAGAQAGKALKRGLNIAMAELYAEGVGAVGSNASKKKK